MIDWIGDTGSELQTAVRAVAIAVALIFVVFRAAQARFAFGAIVVSGLGAAIFLWVVFAIVDGGDDPPLPDIINCDMPGMEGAEGCS